MKQIIDKWGRELTFLNDKEWEEQEERYDSKRNKIYLAYVIFAMVLVLTEFAVRNAKDYDFSGNGGNNPQPTGEVDSYEYSPDTVTVTEEGGVMTIRIDSITFRMVKVEGVTIKMITTRDTSEVTLEDYYVGETEVTQALWKVIMGENPSKNVGDSLPVEGVRPLDCRILVERLSEITGLKFFVPVSMQWDYAASGGKRGKMYRFSGSADLDEVGWYSENSEGRTHAVGSKKPNELGIYDMSGNVSEWCLSRNEPFFDESEYEVACSMLKSFVVRGGSYDSPSEECTVMSRFKPETVVEGEEWGFRLFVSISGDSPR